MANPRVYYRPTQRQEAISLVYAPGNRPLLGGALTLGQLDLPFETVVDLQDVAELREITRVGENGVVLGAATTLQQVVEQTYLPAPIRRALTRAVPLNIRNQASILESLTSPVLLPEWLAVLAARKVTMDKIEADGSENRYDFAELVAGTLGSDDAAHRVGLVRRIMIPPLGRGEALGMAHVARSPADEPIICAAAYIRLGEDLRNVALSHVTAYGASAAPISYLSLAPLEHHPFDEANVASAAKHIPLMIEPVGDWRGSSDYRREMTRVCVQRALLECLEQFRQRTG